MFPQGDVCAAGNDSSVVTTSVCVTVALVKFAVKDLPNLQPSIVDNSVHSIVLEIQEELCQSISQERTEIHVL